MNRIMNCYSSDSESVQNIISMYVYSNLEDWNIGECV